MEFTNFKTLVRDEVAKRTGEQYKVRINDVMKNNGVVLSGITMMQDDSNISPTIYLNHLYEEYENGEATLESIIEQVLDTYEKNKVNRSVDIRFFMNYESIKDRIVFKLIHAERNEELLKDVPHIRYLDLAIVFQCLVSEEMFGNATILIHNAHSKLWHVTQEEIYAEAIKNTPKLQPYKIKNMKDILAEMMPEAQLEELPDTVPMYVLSNKANVQGASCILYPNLLKDFASAINGNFYILPSSIHECIFLPAESVEDPTTLQSMVKEVNMTQVEECEFLSDSVYFYDQSVGELTIVE